MHSRSRLSCLPGKASIAAGKKIAAKQKAAGKGLFKPKTCSPALAAITGKTKMSTIAIVKAVWAYIKAKKSRESAWPEAKLVALAWIEFPVREEMVRRAFLRSSTEYVTQGLES